MSQVYIVSVKDVCPKCGEACDVHAKVNLADVGVAKYVCSANCGHATEWVEDPSVKPYIKSQTTA